MSLRDIILKLEAEVSQEVKFARDVADNYRLQNKEQQEKLERAEAEIAALKEMNRLGEQEEESLLARNLQLTKALTKLQQDPATVSDEVLKQKAEGWDAISKLLTTLHPGWNNLGACGIQSAEIVIRDAFNSRRELQEQYVRMSKDMHNTHTELVNAQAERERIADELQALQGNHAVVLGQLTTSQEALNGVRIHRDQLKALLDDWVSP